MFWLKKIYLIALLEFWCGSEWKLTLSLLVLLMYIPYECMCKAFLNTSKFQSMGNTDLSEEYVDLIVSYLGLSRLYFANSVKHRTPTYWKWSRTLLSIWKMENFPANQKEIFVVGVELSVLSDNCTVPVNFSNLKYHKSFDSLFLTVF